MASKVLVKLSPQPAITYPILIQPHLLQRLESWLPRKSAQTNIVIITDHKVKTLYGQLLAQSLKKSGWQVLLLSFRAGEASKNQQTKQALEEQMLRHGCGRNTWCLALGGGVVGDITGFIAATYMRGIPLLQIPTTLLAMVDSSVGGKTAIDTAYGKNLIGAFWQPTAVVADICCLQSLPKKQLINGLIEAIKMALTHDTKTFQLLEKQWPKCLASDEKILQNIIHRAVKIKVSVVAQDEKEQSGPRLLLNFGHTIGHALEKITDYKMLHGYAVAYGILVEAKIAELLGVLPASDYARIVNLLANLGISGQDLKKYSVETIIQAAKNDKKVKSGKTHYVLLKKIGQVFINKQAYTHSVSDEMVKSAFQKTIEDIYAGK